jgi:hypothetical protein
VTRDDIIAAASKAGFETKRDMIWVDKWEITPTLTRFAALVAAAEREAISDEYSSRLQGDLEHGVKWLNEAASEEFTKKYPELSAFLKWLDARSLR